VTRALARHAFLIVGVAAVGGGLLSLAFRGPGDAPAVWVSAGVAVVLQIVAVAVSRAVSFAGFSARLGAGALVRMLGLMVYALLVALALRFPPVTALITLAALLFASSLLEPILIRS
jgi:hypothetical protein